jgi:hypothetical protein
LLLKYPPTFCEPVLDVVGVPGTVVLGAGFAALAVALQLLWPSEGRS